MGLFCLLGIMILRMSRECEYFWLLYLKVLQYKPCLVLKKCGVVTSGSFAIVVLFTIYKKHSFWNPFNSYDVLMLIYARNLHLSLKKFHITSYLFKQINACS